MVVLSRQCHHFDSHFKFVQHVTPAFMSDNDNGALSIAVTALDSICIRYRSSKEKFVGFMDVNYGGRIVGEVRFRNPEDGCRIGICNMNKTFVTVKNDDSADHINL